MNIKVKLLHNDERLLPHYATDGSAGMDLKSADIWRLSPGERKLIRTGIQVAIPPGYEGQVRPKSGLALKYGITVTNAPGTIDSDYRGEVGVILHNTGAEMIVISYGDKIAQLVIAPCIQCKIDVVQELDETERGEGGFGSTGK
jgi:dUTP pyrophosphatase